MKDCLTCANYYVFYTKDRDHFKKERQGYCEIYKGVVKNHDSCDKWRSNRFRRKVSTKMCIKTLSIAMNNLSQIKQILFEEQEENETNPISQKTTTE